MELDIIYSHFVFSSRRRHTICLSDWSSDVCSSDLLYRKIIAMKATPLVDQLKNETTPIPYLHVFATLTMLKQVCDHPALVIENSNYKEHESGKFELLKELITEALDSDHKIVI